MPKYTLEQIRTTARSKDNRLADTNKYSDDWIDDKIAHAFETAESGKQVFTNEEVVDMQEFINDGTEKFEIEMDEEVHYHYEQISTSSAIRLYIKNDNTILVNLDIDKLASLDASLEKSATFRYFYYPTADFTEIYMGSEIYHYFRHCLYVQLYGALRDLEAEQYHQAQVDKFISEGTFRTPNDMFEYVGMKGSFDTNSGREAWPL